METCKKRAEFVLTLNTVLMPFCLWFAANVDAQKKKHWLYLRKHAFTAKNHRLFTLFAQVHVLKAVSY